MAVTKLLVPPARPRLKKSFDVVNVGQTTTLSNATLKKGQNGSSWTSERSLMFGGNVQNALTPSSSSSSSSSSTAPSSKVSSIDGVSFSEGDLLLQALSGFVLVVTAEGYVFYSSPTIQDYLGFHQSDVVHQSVFELIHTDDRALFRRQLHFALNPNTSQQDGGQSLSEQSSAEVSSNVVTYDPQAVPPENSSFLERNFCCRFRCLLDNSSGFLAMNFRGRLKFIHGQNRVSEDGTPVPPQLALFSIATQMQPPSILEIRTKTLIFQTKHKLDFTPMGIDPRGKVVLGYNEVEISMKGSGYNFIHAADMMYCADNHLKMMKTGESGFTVFRLLSKTGLWIWVQANARLVFKAGKPDFIVARQRALINEEGEDQLRLRRLQLPFNFTTGEALLYDVTPTVDAPDPCSAPKQRKLDDHTVSRESMLGCMLSQDQSLYCDHNKNNAFNTINDAAFKDSHATVSVHGDVWELAAPKPASGGAARSDATVQDMMETLQQILGENDLGAALDVGPEELKSWESTLLKMSSSSCEMSENLDDILSNDILTYVEEQLQREGGLRLPGQLGAVPDCLSALELQNQHPELQNQHPEQTFWPPEPQNQLLPNGGQMAAPPVLGLMKLTHMDLPQLGFSGPALQQTASAALQLGPTGAPVTFNPSTQNQLRTLQVAAKDNNRGSFSLMQPSANQIHLSRAAQPMPSQLRTPSAAAGLWDQSASRQLNPGFSFQGNQWGSNPADAFVETYAQNISSSSSPSCAHFAPKPQSGAGQRPPWSLEQQPAGARLQQTPAYQRNPLHVVNGGPMFRTQEASNVPLPVQPPPPAAPPSSCMFRHAPSSVPLGAVRPNPAGVQIPSKPSCFYQGLPGGGSVPGMTAVPDPGEAAPSCQVTAGLDRDGLLVQHQYLDFSDQTQINILPASGSAGFPFSSLPSGNAYYSQNQ